MATKRKAGKKAFAGKKRTAKAKLSPRGRPFAAAAKKKARKKTASDRKLLQKKAVRAKPAGRQVEKKIRPRDRKLLSAEPVATFTPYVQKRGEQYMNATQAQHFRNILLDWKRSLMEEVDRTVHHMQDEASNFPDPNDRATQEEEFALELRTRDRERKLIKKIDDALMGLDIGEYGYCEVCGVEIGIKRLEARPTATLCIDCKTLDEIKEKQLG